MNLSANTRYAIRLLLELEKPCPPISTAVLAERLNIAVKTIEKIHNVLKKNNITDSVMGVRGGIFLQRPLSQVSVGELVHLFNEGINFAVCHGGNKDECPNNYDCLIAKTWTEVSEKIQAELNAIALSDILNKYTKSECLRERAL